jgi:hypothetical protein
MNWNGQTNAAGSGQTFSLVSSLKMTTPQLGGVFGNILLDLSRSLGEVLWPGMFQIISSVDPLDSMD